MQTALDGLADMDPHVIMTTSIAIDPADLTIPANAHVVRYADHNAILSRADLCVTHGGHGTTMRALKNAVPMVVVPSFPHDQAPNAALVERLGAGLSLPSDTDATALKEAASRILKDTSFKSGAKDHARVVRHLGVASSAVDIQGLDVPNKVIAAIS